MSNNWLFFPSPAAATGLDLIAKATNWQVMNNNSILAAGGITQGLWPTIYSQWGGAITITTDRTLNGFMVFDTIGEYTAFYNAHTGAQGMLLTHRGHNGTTSDPAKYYLWVGTYAQLSWTGRYASFVPTTRWMGEQMTGYYTSTNPSELRALKTIDLQMGASITSVGSGSPPQDAYTGGMTSTTTGTQPTGISSLQHRTYGMGFIFGTNAQRNTFVGNYPNDVGTWYVGLGDSLSFTKPGWTWDLNVGGTTNRAYISVANHEVWHAPNTFAVGDDVQIIHTA
jgi:hypothetical protein